MARRALSMVVIGPLLAALPLGSCDSSDGESIVPATSASGGHGGGGGAAGGAGGASPDVVRVTLFHTSDEHGWLLPDEATYPNLVVGGAANLMGWLVEQEGYVPGEQLLLSSGDNWTGPAISTWFEGQPMVEVFDAMGYAAATIGNHEFDFGLDALAARVSEAAYPYLSANLLDEDSGEPPSFVTPYVVVPVGDLEVGFIGLTPRNTATSIHPLLVEGLVFTDYREALEQQVPEMQAAGADIVVLLAHLGAGHIEEDILPELPVPIHAVFAGHWHELDAIDVDGVPILSSGRDFAAYSRLDLDYDRTLGDVIGYETQQQIVQYLAGEPNPVTPDPAVTAIAEHWQQEADAVLSQVVGYTESGIGERSWAMANWVVDSWLWAYPEADVALQNFGSMRQAIGAGDVTVGDVVGMLPFENTLYLVDITGAELLAELEYAVEGCGVQSSCYPSVGGMRYQLVGPDLQVTLDGAGDLEPATSYTVVITDYVYYGGGGYLFQDYDPTPIDTGAHMRQPVLDWTTGLGTSAADPLESYLDPLPRDG